jgi:ribonuclease HII
VFLLGFEQDLWAQGFVRVAGVDEAGRGPLAGPVVAAAVVFERGFLEAESSRSLNGLDDSKKLSPSIRRHFHDLLVNSPHVDCGIGVADHEEIDRINIMRATYEAMKRAIIALSSQPDYVLVDGLPVAGLPFESTAIVGGDSKSISIAAGSVVAKVTRDTMMVEIDRIYPRYGFSKHKGYGTKLHMMALFEYGPCAVHRRSFQPVRDAAQITSRNPHPDVQHNGSN